MTGELRALHDRLSATTIYVTHDQLEAMAMAARPAKSTSVRQASSSFLYVTHDQIEAMTMATKIGVIDGGCLVQVGTPREIYETPANVYVAQRLGQPSINLMPRRLLPDLPVPGEAALIGARTEHLRIARAEKSAAHGRVTWIERLG
ncbi:MAG: hypothetical protein JOZ17_11190, partial [Acetobacteraceae bacterium]|nr:hypothetical protein [Acetobacteraceae bacterium]